MGLDVGSLQCLKFYILGFGFASSRFGVVFHNGQQGGGGGGV